jgi:hypothetical protein
MQRLRFLVVLILVIAPPILSSQESQTASDQLWSWFGNCGEKRYMEVEVVLSGKVICQSSFPICPIPDRSKEVEKRLVFSFKGGHVFQGEYPTTPTQTIEGNIWQAGADPGAILLGISFSTKKQVLLNTIHVAKAGRASVSEIDPGLTVRTIPISHKHSE